MSCPGYSSIIRPVTARRDKRSSILGQTSRSEKILSICLVAVGLLVIALWNAAGIFGVDFDTGAEVVIGLLPLMGMWAVLRYFTPIRFGDTWPLALAGFWSCWWPALDYWSDPAGRIAGSGHEDLPPRWYASEPVKWEVLVALVVLGYLLRRWLLGRRAASATGAPATGPVPPPT